MTKYANHFPAHDQNKRLTSPNIMMSAIIRRARSYENAMLGIPLSLDKQTFNGPIIFLQKLTLTKVFRLSQSILYLKSQPSER